jgi:hypothetical protein
MDRNTALKIAYQIGKTTDHFYELSSGEKWAFAQWVYAAQPTRKEVPLKVSRLFADHFPRGVLDPPESKPYKSKQRLDVGEALHKFIVKPDRETQWATDMVHRNPENQMVEATDGRVAFQHRNGKIKSEGYYAPNGAVLKPKDVPNGFPRIDQCIQSVPFDEGSWRMPVDELIGFCREVKKRLAAFNRDGVAAFVTRYDADQFVLLDIDRLLDVLYTFHALGTEKINVVASATNAPLALSDNSGNRAVVMPLRPCVNQYNRNIYMFGAQPDEMVELRKYVKELD